VSDILVGFKINYNLPLQVAEFASNFNKIMIWCSNYCLNLSYLILCWSVSTKQRHWNLRFSRRWRFKSWSTALWRH